MQESPHAFPVVQVLQHAMGVSEPSSAAGVMTTAAASGLLPRLAVAVARTRPNTDAQILNVAVMLDPPRWNPCGYGRSFEASEQNCPRRAQNSLRWTGIPAGDIARHPIQDDLCAMASRGA